MTPEALAFQVEANVSRETLQRLEHYAELLKRWNSRINLVSRGTMDEIWRRHFLDSAQIFEHLPPGGQSCADFGSGGGFPGAVLAILAREGRPDLNFTLVEADQRKSVFLRTVARELSLGLTVLPERIEAIGPLRADIITARALAPLKTLLSMAYHHATDGTRCYFLKGAGAQAEIEEALEAWSFNCKSYPSKTDQEAVILEIGEIERV